MLISIFWSVAKVLFISSKVCAIPPDFKGAAFIPGDIIPAKDSDDGCQLVYPEWLNMMKERGGRANWRKLPYIESFVDKSFGRNPSKNIVLLSRYRCQNGSQLHNIENPDSIKIEEGYSWLIECNALTERIQWDPKRWGRFISRLRASASCIVRAGTKRKREVMAGTSECLDTDPNVTETTDEAWASLEPTLKVLDNAIVFDSITSTELGTSQNPIFVSEAQILSFQAKPRTIYRVCAHAPAGQANLWLHIGSR